MNNAEWSIGDIILDLYEVKEIFTSGGMGIVYRIYHRGWNSDMAMKSPRPEYFMTETQKSGFEHEAETWINLGLHPNIVSCYYVRRIGGVPCVFAEYLEGGSLREWIRQGRIKSLDTVLDIAVQFATGLHYAHEKGLIHQDVKPANVMMTSDGIVKVTDFGLARAQSYSAVDEFYPSASGTPPQKQRKKSHVSSFGGMTQAYCSCEQASRSPLTLKTDIWSWGVSILEMFLGGVTWLSGNVAATVLDDYLRNPPTGANIGHMPKPLSALLRRCFRQDPLQRPENMQEIITELKQIYKDIVGKDYPRGDYLTGRLTADSLNNRAVSLLDLGRSEEAVGMWRESLRTDPHHIESTLNLALYEWKLCAITERDLFRRVDELMRSQTLKHRDYNLMGRMYMFFSEYGKALDFMWKGLKEGTASVDEIKSLVAALCAEGRHSSKKDNTAAMSLWKDVEKYSRLVIDGGSRDIQTIAAHAMSLTRQGKTSEAIAFYDKMKTDVQSSPNSVMAAALGYLPGYEVVNTFEGHSGLVGMVILSADGKVAVSAGSEDRSVRLWRMDTGECLRVLDGHGDWITCVCFSADGATVISGSLDKTLRFWDIARGKCTRVIDAHKDGVTAVTATVDGRYVISGGNDAVIRIWNSGNLVRALQGHKGRISSLSSISRGPYVISASYDRTVRIWNIVTGKCLTTMAGHEGAVNHIAKSDDSSHILTSGEDMTIRLWDTTSGKHLRTFGGHNGAVTASAFLPNGRGFISGSTDNTLCRWDLVSGQRQYVLKKFEGPSLALSPDGKTALYSVWNGLRVVNILNRFVLPYAIAVPVSSEEAGRREGGFQTIIEEAERLINEGNLNTVAELIRKGRQIKGYERDRDALKLMERLSRVFPKRKVTGAWESAAVDGHNGSINAVDVSKYLVTGGDDGKVAVWDVRSMNCIKTLGGHKGAVNAVAISDDDRFVLSGGEDTRVRLWDVEKGECQWVFGRHTAPVTAVAFSYDGKYAISGSLDGAVVLMDIKSGLELRVFYERHGRVTCAAVTADLSTIIAGYENGGLQFWDIDTEECIASLKPYNNSVSSVAISRDIRHVVCTGRFENTFHIVETTTKKLTRSFRGHTGGVLAARFSYDGKFLISGSEDGTVRLWETDTGRVSRTFSGHAAGGVGGVNAVSFAVDGWSAYCGGADRMLRAFYIDWELQTKDFTNWDDGAAVYLELFITRRTPFLKDSFIRRGTPVWGQSDFESLLSELGLCGYGWLTSEGVAAKLYELGQEAKTSWWLSEESFNASITQARELMKMGSYTAALSQINKARAINGYNNEREALELLKEMSLTFPRTRLSSCLRQNVLKGHGGGITAVVFTDDETIAVTASKDNRVRMWDLSTGNCVKTLSGTPVTAMIMCAAGHVCFGGSDGSIRLWDIKTGVVKRILKGHTAEILSLSHARGGGLVLSASKDGLIILWDVETGERIRLYRCPSGSVTCATIDAALEFIASGSTDRLIRIWDCATGAVTKTLAGHTDAVTALAASPDGTFIVSGGAARRVRMWDVASGQNTAVFEGHSGAVTSLQVSPDGRFFISGSADNSALVWDKSKPGSFVALSGHSAAVTSVSLSTSASMTITASEDRTAFVWSLQWDFTIRDFTDWIDGALPYVKRFLLSHTKMINDTLTTVGLSVMKDEDMTKLREELRQRGFGWLGKEGIDAKVAELKASADMEWKERVSHFKTLLKTGIDYIGDKQYSKAIETLSSSHLLSGFQREEQPLRLLEKMHGIFPKTKLLDVWRVNYLVGHRGRITDLAVFSDNRHAVTASADKTLRFWDIITGKCIRVFEGHTGGVTAVSLTADNRSVVSSDTDGTIRQWDVISGECVRVIGAHRDAVTAVAAVADNRRILSGSADGTIKLWDSFTGDCLNTLQSGRPSALAISPDALYFFSGSLNSDAEIWDLSSGQPIHKFKGTAKSGISSLTVMPTGRYLLTTGGDKSARLFDIPTGESFRTFAWQTGRPVSASITPNGKCAVIGGDDGTMRLYDILTGELISSVHWHIGALAALAVSPDCRYIITGGDEMAAGVWYAYWQTTVKKPAEWDVGARPFIEIFLTVRTAGRYPAVKKPQWTEDDFKELQKELSLRGYGWLTTSGIKTKLDEISANWKTVLSERRHLFEKEFRQG